MGKVKVNELTVKVTYTASLLELEMPEDVYKEIEEAFDNGDEIEVHGSLYTEAQEWLTQNFREADSVDWEVEIVDIVTK